MALYCWHRLCQFDSSCLALRKLVKEFSVFGGQEGKICQPLSESVLVVVTSFSLIKCIVPFQTFLFSDVINGSFYL